MPEAGWYYADGDPAGTQRYWDGAAWVGEPTAVSAAPVNPAPVPAPPMAPTTTPATPTTTAPASVTNQRIGRPATAGNRMLGRFIDVVLAFVFVAVVVFLDLGGSPNIAVVDNPDVTFNINGRSLDTTLEYLLWGLGIFVWNAAWIHLKGGTPGKLLLKMRVTDEATGQMPVGLGQACVRTANLLLPLLGVVSLGLANLVSTIGFVIGLVSLVLLFSDGAHRTVMDRLAKTVVVQL